MIKKDSRDHWNEVYSKKETSLLGWYEENPVASLRMVKSCGLSFDSRILVAGAGSTFLIDHLLNEGYSSLIASDISSPAMERIQFRLGRLRNLVDWIVDDLTNATHLHTIDPVSLWLDRAVFHFFIHDSDRQKYLQLLNRLVHPGGFVMIATFNLQGAKMCSGLPVQRYNAPLLEKTLGDKYQLIKWFDEDYTMPSGEIRPYVYTLFKQIA